MLFKSMTYFFNFFILPHLWVLVLGIIPYRCMICKYFIPSSMMSFYSVDSFFWMQKFLKLFVPFVYFRVFMLPVLLVCHIKTYCLIRNVMSFSYFFLLGSFILLGLLLVDISQFQTLLYHLTFLIFLVFPSCNLSLWTSFVRLLIHISDIMCGIHVVSLVKNKFRIWFRTELANCFCSYMIVNILDMVPSLLQLIQLILSMKKQS